jgi:hypothetical protein
MATSTFHALVDNSLRPRRFTGRVARTAKRLVREARRRPSAVAVSAQLEDVRDAFTNADRDHRVAVFERVAQ